MGLLATLAPRPLGLTAVRIMAPAFAGAAVAAAPRLDALDAAGALLSTGFAVAIVARPETATVFANGAAYGNELRLPLRSPPILAGLLAPVAVFAVAAGAVSGPLLLADGNLTVGIPATAGGVLVAAFLARSLHHLWRRWLVFVPGGVVVHDSLTLLDPTLLPRDRIAGLRPLDAVSDVPDGTVDLRLGARSGAVLVDLKEPVPLAVMSRNRREATMTRGPAVIVSLARPGTALAEAGRRRLPVG